MKTVYLSPSTQHNNIGAGGYGSECDRMNQVADVIQKVLESYGIAVYRNKPVMNLAQVVKDSNSRKPDIHLSIHSNADSGKARGCEVFCHKLGWEGEKLARAIYAELSALSPTSDRGIKEGCNFYGQGKPLYELAKTDAPAALAEIAFHDNSEDAQWIISSIEQIGNALAKGVLRYFKIPVREDTQNLDRDLKVLQEFGVIQTPDYWRLNAVKGKAVDGEYAAILISRAAALLMKRRN